MDNNDILLNIFYQIDDLESIITLLRINKQIRDHLKKNLTKIIQNIYDKNHKILCKQDKKYYDLINKFDVELHICESDKNYIINGIVNSNHHSFVNYIYLTPYECKKFVTLSHDYSWYCANNKSKNKNKKKSQYRLNNKDLRHYFYKIKNKE